MDKYGRPLRCMTLHHRSWGVYYNEVVPLGWSQARQRPVTVGDNLNLVSNTRRSPENGP